MVTRIPNLFLVSMLLIVALACVAPVGVTTPDPDFINTAIAQTQTAAPAIPITGQESLTPTFTRAPSATPFPTFTVVVIEAPQLRVSVATDCRTGPGAIYDRVGILRVGEVAEAVGRSADGNFWVIRNPDRAGETCWISGVNATLSGLTGILPVVAPPPTPTPTNTRVPTSTPTRTPSPTSTPSHTPTPTFTATSSPTSTPTSSFTPTSTPTSSATPTPSFTPTTSTPTTSPTSTSTLSPTPTSSSTPTPTPTSTATSTPSSTSTPTPSPTSTPLLGFAASYNGMDSCTGTGWWVELALQNIGGTSFESLAVTLIDTAIGTVLPLNTEDFTNRDGCTTSTTQTNLPPGATRIVSLPVFIYDPAGHNLQATISLCSDPGRSGLCVVEAINFTP